MVRVEKAGANTNVIFKPGSIKAALEEISLYDGNTEIELSYSMWNDASLTQAFNKTDAKDLQLRLKIRTGLKTKMLTIALNDQPLP